MLILNILFQAPCSKAAAAPAAKEEAAEEKKDDDFDLFGSDEEEEDEEKKKIVEERLKAYNAKKSAKVCFVTLFRFYELFSAWTHRQVFRHSRRQALGR